MQKIKSFRSFTESREKELIVTFAQFQPPSLGHSKLLDTVVELAKGGKTYRIYTSQDVDTENNPLNYDEKIKFMRKMFPSYGRNILHDTNIEDIHDIVTKAYNDNSFSKLTLVVASGFKDVVDKIKSDFKEKFKDGIHIKIVGNVKSDESKMKKLATDNDLISFVKNLPSEFTEGTELFNAVRKGMGIKEKSDSQKVIESVKNISEKREQYIAGNIFKIGSKVWSEKIREVIFTVMERHSNFVVCETYDGEVKTKIFIQDLHESSIV